jgi:hypothetical protein
MLTHPLIALTALIAHIFRTTESPIACPARFPDLVRLVRTFLQRDQHGERTVVAGWHHLNQQRSLIALTALLAHFFPGQSLGSRRYHPLRRIRRTLSPATHGNRSRVEMFQPLSATMNLAGARESDTYAEGKMLK